MAIVSACGLPPSVPHQREPLAARGSMVLASAVDQQRPRLVIRIKIKTDDVSGSRASLESRNAPAVANQDASPQTVASSPVLVRVAQDASNVAHDGIRIRMQELADLKSELAEIENTAARRKRWRTQTYSLKIARVYLAMAEIGQLLKENPLSLEQMDRKFEQIRTDLKSVSKSLARKQSRVDFFRS